MYMLNTIIIEFLSPALNNSGNADLYVFNDQMAQGYRGVNINIRDDEESVGEMHMKDYVDVDVSNQENVAPVYFQSLSLD